MNTIKVTRIFLIYVLMLLGFLDSPFFIQRVAFAFSHDVSLPGLDPNNEHRMWVNLKEKPWCIIGRVQTELGQKCTGFFIAPRLIMTAAHCLWIKKTNRLVPTRSVHFLWGYQKGYYIKDIKIKQIVINKEYVGQSKINVPLNNIVKDRAYLVVDKATINSKDIVPLQSISSLSHAALWLGGYEQDKKEVFQVDPHCNITNIIQVNTHQKVIEHNCEATFGSSGSPLFVKDKNKEWSIIGMQIAAFTAGKGGIANPILQLMQ
ncbi:trypsin-like serine protease [Commensalibacter sp. Nvir]|uniref:trypsin-like serine peptidase n=1 Tax=Commensalibacter sp. Nvir TaxID=3069817 RepID=UPI0030C89B5F